MRSWIDPLGRRQSSASASATQRIQLGICSHVHKTFTLKSKGNVMVDELLHSLRPIWKAASLWLPLHFSHGCCFKKENKLV